MLHGKIDVFYSRDLKGDCYFIQKQGDSLINITAKDDEVISNESRYLKPNNRYIGVLNYQMRDAPGIQSEINNTRLTSNDLIKLAKTYHQKVCNDYECVVYEKKLPKFKVRFGLLAGNISSIKSTYIKPDSYNEIRIKQPSGLAYGLFVNFPVPSINNRLSLQYEGLYKKNCYQADYYQTTLIHATVPIGTVLADVSAFYHSVNLRYDFQSGKLRPLLQVGIGLTQFINSDRDNIFDPLNIGFSGGAGCAYKLSKRQEVFIRLFYCLNINGGYDPNTIQKFIMHDFNLTLGFLII